MCVQGGGMPANIGRYSDGVERTHSVIIRIVSLGLTFSLHVCLLQQNTGAALCTITSGVFAPHDVPATLRSKLLSTDVLARNFKNHVSDSSTTCD